MHLPLALVLLILSSSAHAFHSISRLHSFAARHSAGFARDLRTTFRPIFAVDPSSSLPHHARCHAVPAPSRKTSGNATSSDSGTPSTSSSGDPKSPKPNQPNNLPPSPWQLTTTHQGQNFFDRWTFWNFPDPTHGTVDYQSEGAAWRRNLIEVNKQGDVLLKVDTTQNVQGNRASVRIHGVDVFNGGLVLLDAVHMPTGCGTWPAFWSNGPNWPLNGEIDVVEGVNDHSSNQATIHTGSGCKLDTNAATRIVMSGAVVGGNNCAAEETGNQGCGVRSKDPTSFGAAFNRGGGGVYAMRWDENGIAVWFFDRNSIPADIKADVPRTSSWGPPSAVWPPSQCDPFKFFKDHNLIINTALCGDWAASAWGESGIPGQEQSCAARTGVATCEEFVRTRGDAFKEAYWQIRSVKYFKKK